jgi:hypothetical protein
MNRAVLVVVLVLAACSPEETAGSSTSSSTTTMATTTTEATTTTVATTTTLATTTTTTATTTTSLLAGNWADQPLVTTDFGALGWWDGLEWVDAETEGALPIVGGEDYQVIRVGVLGLTTAGPQATVCDPLELIGVELEDPDLLGAFPGPYGVAISAPWELQPHLFEAATDTNGDYAGFARDFLASRGMNVPNPVITQLFRTDLEGDGVNEVLFVAEDVSPGYLLEVGDYSVALMRKVIEGEVQTAVLGDTVVLDEDQQFEGGHRVGAVGDLNGDGKMEIVMNGAFFESFGVSVWEYVNDDLGLTMVLQTGCGS